MLAILATWYIILQPYLKKHILVFHKTSGMNKSCNHDLQGSANRQILLRWRVLLQIPFSESPKIMKASLQYTKL